MDSLLSSTVLLPLFLVAIIFIVFYLFYRWDKKQSFLKDNYDSYQIDEFYLTEEMKKDPDIIIKFVGYDRSYDTPLAIYNILDKRPKGEKMVTES